MSNGDPQASFVSETWVSRWFCALKSLEITLDNPEKDAAFCLQLEASCLWWIFYLQLTILVCLLTVEVILLTALACLLTIGVFCLHWESASNKGLKGL